MAKFWIESVVFLLILCYFQVSFSKRPFSIKLSNCKYMCGKPELCEANCTIAKDGELTKINGFLNLLKDYDTFEVWLEASIKGRHSDSYLTILNETITDICPHLTKNNRASFLQLFIDEFAKYGKMPSCPIKKDVYYIKNFFVSPEYFPPYVPEADFKIVGITYGVVNDKKEEIYKYSYTGSIVMNKN